VRHNLFTATDHGGSWPVTWDADVPMTPCQSIRFRRVRTYDTREQATEGAVELFERLRGVSEPRCPFRAPQPPVAP